MPGRCQQGPWNDAPERSECAALLHRPAAADPAAMRDPAGEPAGQARGSIEGRGGRLAARKLAKVRRLGSRFCCEFKKGKEVSSAFGWIRLW